MKIEKITENKIRIILKQEDFKDKSIDIQKLLLTTPESQSLFLEILNRAKKEVNFDTDGHKLLIEAFFQNDDIFIFTITKYIEPNSIQKHKQKKYLTAKRKIQTLNKSCSIYEFNNFEDFCEFCDFINKNNNINLRGLFKTSILYFYNNTYYLVIDGINTSHKSLNLFHSSLLEFSIFLTYTINFNFKLKEHGRIIIKNNAIHTGIKYFSKYSPKTKPENPSL